MSIFYSLESVCLYWIILIPDYEPLVTVLEPS